MRYFYSIFSFLLIPLTLGGLPTVAAQTVNGQAISQNRLEAQLALRLAAGQKDEESTRQQAREDLIRLEVLMQAARKAGAETPLVRAQAQNAADNVLVRAYLQQWIRQNPVSKEAVAPAIGSVEPHRIAHRERGRQRSHAVRIPQVEIRAGHEPLHPVAEVGPY